MSGEIEIISRSNDAYAGPYCTLPYDIICQRRPSCFNNCLGITNICGEGANKMFCPKCRSEYRSGFTRCSDCEIDLVHDLPPPPPAEMEYVDYEAILETNSPGDIALVKSVLEAEEITYFFQGEY